MAYGGVTIGDVWGDLQEYYSNETVLVDLLLKNRPLYAMVKRKSDHAGKVYPLPITSSGSGGGGPSFEQAYQNQSPSIVREFMLSMSEYWYLQTIQTETLEATRNSRGAFMSAVKLEIQNGMTQWANGLAKLLYGNGNGAFGSVNSINSGAILLNFITDAINFFPGLVVQAISTAGVVRSGVGYVLTSDWSLGSVTVAAASGGSAATPAGWVATDILVQSGSYNTSIAGLGRWLPTGAARPVNGGTQQQNILFNVDRSINPTQYAGTYWDGSGETVEEGIIDLLTAMYTFGAQDARYIFVNPRSFAAFQKSAQSRVVETDIETEAGISVGALKFRSQMGDSFLISDPYCTPMRAYALNMDTVSLVSYGPCPKIVMNDGGGPLITLPNLPASQLRIVGFPQLGLSAPSWCGVGILSE